MLRGHLLALPWLFQAGAVALMAALLFAAWRAQDRRAIAAPLAVLATLPVGLAALEALGVFAPAPEEPDPLAELWTARARERAILEGALPIEGETLPFFGHTIDLAPQGWRRAKPAPDAFRIVATGGATTFGSPRTPEEAPWPEALEARIASELRCRVPVAVVNAGVPGRGIQATLGSLGEDLTTLDPDLLIHLPDTEDLAAIVRSLPDITLPEREALPQRASQLFRRFEQARRADQSAAIFANAARRADPDGDLRDTPLGRAYRTLVLEARTRGVDVIFLPIVLAVGTSSPEAALHRFERLEPRTRRFALARPLHQRLLRQVAAANRAGFLDTTPGLDSTEAQHFLHLATLSQAGHEQLAEHVFEGLRDRLAESEAGCVPRAR